MCFIYFYLLKYLLPIKSYIITILILYVYSITSTVRMPFMHYKSVFAHPSKLISKQNLFFKLHSETCRNVVCLSVLFLF